MNNENLKKGSRTRFRSGEVAARNGKKGGLANGQRRRDKRELYKILKDLLALPMTDVTGNPVTSPITGNPMSIMEAMAMTTIQKAIKGSVQHIRLIIDVMGWKAPQRVDATVIKETDTRTIDEMTRELRRLTRHDALLLDDKQARQLDEILDVLYPVAEGGSAY